MYGCEYNTEESQMKLFSVFQYMQAKIELLRVIDCTNITPGLVYLHTVLTGSPYGHTRLEQDTLRHKYPEIYKRFIRDRYEDSIIEIRNELWAIYDMLDSVSDLDKCQGLPLTYDLRNQVDEFLKLNILYDRERIEESIQILRPILIYHISKYDVDNTDTPYYIKSPYRMVSKNIFNIKQDSLALDMLQLYILLRYTKLHIYLAQQRNSIRDNRFSDIKLLQEKTISNEVVMCGGIKELPRLSRFADTSEYGISDVAKRYLVEASIMHRKILWRKHGIPRRPKMYA